MTLDVSGFAGVASLIGGTGVDTLITDGAVTVTVDAGAGADIITITGGSATTIVTDAGDSGLTAATIDTITGFVVADDSLDFNLTDGPATNFIDGGASEQLY